MRVISGRYRGRKLLAPKGLELRPTSDRLKQTLFDILGVEVSDGIMLDVFAGTGAIGIEALSRGAREIIFIERDKGNCLLIQKNLELCGITSGYRLLQQDVFAALRRLGREGLSADTIFLDPPYNWELYDDVLETIFRAGLAKPTSRVIVEHHRKAELPSESDGYRCVRTVRQSDKCLSFYAVHP